MLCHWEFLIWLLHLLYRYIMIPIASRVRWAFFTSYVNTGPTLLGPCMPATKCKTFHRDRDHKQYSFCAADGLEHPIMSSTKCTWIKRSEAVLASFKHENINNQVPVVSPLLCNNSPNLLLQMYFNIEVWSSTDLLDMKILTTRS